MRTEPTSANRNTESTESAEHTPHRGERKPVDPALAERFRALLAQIGGDTSGQHAGAAPLTGDDATPLVTESLAGTVASDPGLTQPVPRVWLDAAPQAAAPPPPTPAATLADLIEKHVRQLLVGETSATGDPGHVMLRLSDESLPDTDLLLSRSAQGWSLRVESGRADSKQRVQGGSDELIERFQARSLGKLEVQIVERHGQVQSG